jgi:hypothetical protein
MKILSGHISPETAFVVDDYPYGFRLRCKIRYWLEFHPRHGFRFMSQTTNPKRGHIWNKAKASTYAKFGAAMYLDDQEHVTWAGLSEYSDGAEAQAFKDKYFEGVPEAGRPTLNQWVAMKLAYDGARAEDKANGKILPLEVGIIEAREARLANPVTREEKLVAIWRNTHADFKGKIDGKACILVLREGGTHSVPLTDLTDDEIADKLPKHA